MELGLVEQRLKAVHEVLDGATVTDVAKRNGVTRQTVHAWLRRYASSGVAGLVDKTSKPESCPHQMTPVVEARIVEWADNARELADALAFVASTPGTGATWALATSAGAVSPLGDRLVFTVEETAQLLGISRSFAYEAVQRARSHPCA